MSFLKILREKKKEWLVCKIFIQLIKYTFVNKLTYKTCDDWISYENSYKRYFMLVDKLTNIP